MSSNKPNKWDLDPHLIKCIGLLHSSKNLRKGDQIPLQKELEKALFEEYGIKRDYTDFFQSHLPPREQSAEAPSTSGSGSSSTSTTKEKVDPEVPSTSGSGSRPSASSSTSTTKEKVDPVVPSTRGSSSEPSAGSSKSPIEKKVNPIVEVSDSDENVDIGDAGDDEELESLIGNDLLCVKCKKMTMEPKNCLIECSECHRLYHQLCHRPPVLKYRQTWACIDCQNLRYMGFSLAERSLKLKELQKKQAQEISKKLSQQKINKDETSSSGSSSSSSRSSSSGRSSPKRGSRFDSPMPGTSSSSESQLVVDESSEEYQPPCQKKSIKGVPRPSKTKKK